MCFRFKKKNTIASETTTTDQSNMNYKTRILLLLIIGFFYRLHGKTTNSFIFPDEAKKHVWLTTDSDGVIFNQDTTQADKIKRKDSLNSASYTKENSGASIFLLSYVYVLLSVVCMISFA